MAESSLDSLAEKRAIEVERKAFELRPEGAPPVDPDYRAQIEQNWPRTIEMGRQYGVEMKHHRFGIDTRPAHRAYKIVQEIAPAQVEAFHWAIFRAYFQEDRDIGDTGVLASLAEELGIDTAAFRERMVSDHALAEVMAEEETALRNGIRGVPAFIFQDRYLVTGLLPPESFEAVLQQVDQAERDRMDEDDASTTAG